MEIEIREMVEMAGLSEEILEVHGITPGKKPEGVTRLIYENLNGLKNRIEGNEKLDKAKEIINDLEVDIVAYNEHRMNLGYKQNRNGLSQMFNGGECEVRSVAGHNVHEKQCGRVQQEGTAMMLYGPLIEQFDFKSSGKDNTGLGRWVYMTLQRGDGIVTRIVCGYNSCNSGTKATCSSYQQQRRHFITRKRDRTSPRTRFKTDLITQLKEWRRKGNRLIVCMGVNKDIYRKIIGKSLTDSEDLQMVEAVGNYTGLKIKATFFRGSKPIDDVWTTPDVAVTGGCVMSDGYGVGDHCLCVVDILTLSLIGHNPPKIFKAAERRLNTTMPKAETNHLKKIESLVVKHCIVERLIRANSTSKSKEFLKIKLDAIYNEQKECMLNTKKQCRKI